MQSNYNRLEYKLVERLELFSIQVYVYVNEIDTFGQV